MGYSIFQSVAASGKYFFSDSFTITISPFVEVSISIVSLLRLLTHIMEYKVQRPFYAHTRSGVGTGFYILSRYFYLVTSLKLLPGLAGT